STPPATTDIYTLSLHDALPISPVARTRAGKFATCILLGLDDATLTGAPRKMLLGSWQRLQEPDSIVIDNAGYILLFPGEPLELRSEEHTSELQSPCNLVCRLLL